MVFLLLLSACFSSTLATIKCRTSQGGIFAECYTGWCKTFINTEGKMELGCDIGGDCAKLMGPYSQQHQALEDRCRSFSGRTFCCCNYDLCNVVPNGSPTATAPIFGLMLLIYSLW
ncbi:unnamed protein product, partial [Mesorhabditis spiculigera]